MIVKSIQYYIEDKVYYPVMVDNRLTDRKTRRSVEQILEFVLIIQEFVPNKFINTIRELDYD